MPFNDPFDDSADKNRNEQTPAIAHETLRESLALVKPTVPLQWAKICPIDWPYPDYKEEYLRSKIVLPEQVLVTRWAGIAPPEEIQTWLANPRRKWERDQVQFQMHQDRAPRPTAELIAWENYKEREIVVEQIDALRSEIEMRQTTQVEMIFDDTGKPIHRRLTRDLKESEVERKRRELREQIKTRRLLDGEATEITENRAEGEVSIEVLITQAREKSDPVFAAAMRIANRLPAPAPKGEVYEADYVDSTDKNPGP